MRYSELLSPPPPGPQSTPLKWFQVHVKIFSSSLAIFAAATGTKSAESIHLLLHHHLLLPLLLLRILFPAVKIVINVQMGILFDHNNTT